MPERGKEKDQLANTNHFRRTLTTFLITQTRSGMLENCLTLNAEEVLPCMHGKAGLVAG